MQGMDEKKKEDSKKALQIAIESKNGLPLDLDEELACGLSRRTIAEMRKNGMSKPRLVSWGDWLGPKKLSNRQLLICYLSAAGRTGREIAKTTGMKDCRISLLLQSQAMREQTQLIREIEFQGSQIESIFLR